MTTEYQTADHLRGTRQRLGMTQTTMAAHLGVSYRTVQSWEAGRHRIPRTVFLSLEQLEAEQRAGVPEAQPAPDPVSERATRTLSAYLNGRQPT